MKIFFDDKGRFLSNSGYGNLTRNLAKSLVMNNCEVIFDEKIPLQWSRTIPSKKREYILDTIKFGKINQADISLTISPPIAKPTSNIPNAIYTQNALGGLIKSWGEYCSTYDGVIVPGEFDKNFFSKWNDNIFTCPQIVDNDIFKNRPKWREEGSDKFTLIFIGSFSYRKGIDILLESFCKFSKIDGGKSKLILICPGAKNINYLLHKIREFNPSADIEIHIEDLSQDWICRYINRSDAFITLSRGEGWCMPVFESILSEKPIILPNSTAMGEATPNESTIKIPVKHKIINSISDPFGSGFKNKYSEDNSYSYDVDVKDVINSIILMRDNYQYFRERCKSSRDFVLNNYSHSNVGSILKDTLEKTLKSAL